MIYKSDKNNILKTNNILIQVKDNSMIQKEAVCYYQESIHLG